MDKGLQDHFHAYLSVFFLGHGC